MRIRTPALVFLLLYPWIVGFSTDSTERSWTLRVGAGMGAYHQVERDCYAVETSDSTTVYQDSVAIDRMSRYTDAAVEVNHDDGLIQYGARAGMFRARDNRYLFDTDRFLNANILLASSPRLRSFAPVTMWYANPYVSIHGNRSSFSGHFNFGLLFGIAPAETSTGVLPTVGGGIQIDSVFFLEGSFLEGVPLVSDGGPFRAMIGTCFSRLNRTMLWTGIGIGAPYHDGVVFVKSDIPLNERVSLGVTGSGLASAEWSLASSLRWKF